MTPPNSTQLGKVWLNPDTPSINAHDVAQILVQTNDINSHQLIKSDQGTSVLKVTHNNQHYIVKQYQLSGYKKSLYQWVKRTPAWREWHGAFRLHRANLRTAIPLALIHHAANPASNPAFITQSLITPFIEGLTLGDLIKSPEHLPPDISRIDIASAIGNQIGHMTRAQIINRDHKVRNLIINLPTLNQNTEPVIIDPAGLRKLRPGLSQLTTMLGLLKLTALQHGHVSPEEQLTVVNAITNTNPTLKPHTDQIIAKTNHIAANWNK